MSEGKEKKIFRESEVKNRKDKSTLLIIHDNVYDVTKFLEEVSLDAILCYILVNGGHRFYIQRQRHGSSHVCRSVPDCVNSVKMWDKNAYVNCIRPYWILFSVFVAATFRKYRYGYATGLRGIFDRFLTNIIFF